MLQTQRKKESWSKNHTTNNSSLQSWLIAFFFHFGAKKRIEFSEEKRLIPGKA
jgi:phenylalanyl-tRNA synthetase beta subunit